MTEEDVARIHHERIRLIRQIEHKDFSLPSWDETRADIKAAPIRAVRIVLNDPKITPSAIHAEKVANRAKLGWRWGEVKDIENRIDPYLCPYDDLPLDRQIENTLLIETVNALRMLIERR